MQRQFFEALVRAAAIKYSNRSDLPTLADKLEYLFKNKLTAFATKYKAKSIEEEVISCSNLILFRNNSRLQRRSLTSMKDLSRRYSLTSLSQSRMNHSRISQCPLKRSLTCSRKPLLYAAVMASQHLLPSLLRILSVLSKSISHLSRDFRISWHLKSFSKLIWMLTLP